MGEENRQNVVLPLPQPAHREHLRLCPKKRYFPPSFPAWQGRERRGPCPGRSVSMVRVVFGGTDSMNTLAIRALEHSAKCSVPIAQYGVLGTKYLVLSPDRRSARIRSPAVGHDSRFRRNCPTSHDPRGVGLLSQLPLDRAESVRSTAEKPFSDLDSSKSRRYRPALFSDH